RKARPYRRPPASLEGRPATRLVRALRRFATFALPFRRSLQLPAGGVDIAAAGGAHGRRDAAFEYDVAERPDPLGLGAFVGCAGPGIERDQVDLGRQPVPADQPHELARILVAVVLALQHH